MTTHPLLSHHQHINANRLMNERLPSICIPRYTKEGYYTGITTLVPEMGFKIVTDNSSHRYISNCPNVTLIPYYHINATCHTLTSAYPTQCACIPLIDFSHGKYQILPWLTLLANALVAYRENPNKTYSEKIIANKDSVIYTNNNPNLTFNLYLKWSLKTNGVGLQYLTTSQTSEYCKSCYIPLIEHHTDLNHHILNSLTTLGDTLDTFLKFSNANLTNYQLNTYYSTIKYDDKTYSLSMKDHPIDLGGSHLLGFDVYCDELDIELIKPMIREIDDLLLQPNNETRIEAMNRYVNLIKTYNYPSIYYAYHLLEWL